MSEPTSPNDRRDADGSGKGDDGPPVPEPVDDETTVELVCDAIGVARGELSDKRFSRKYATTRDVPENGDADAPDP